LIVMNETLGNLVRLTLQHGSYETRRTTDPQECRDIMGEWSPHIAFLDLDLYEQFIDIVGRGLTHGHTPIIAFTRRRDTKLKLSAYERGADDIVEMPFTLDEIVARPFALMRRAHGISVTIVPKIKLDGLEVLRRLRADDRARFVPVVLLTSSDEEQDMVRGYSLGANSYVRKPIDFAQFSEAVRQLGLYWLLLNEVPRGAR